MSGAPEKHVPGVPGLWRAGLLAPKEMGRGSVKWFRRPCSHETIVRLDEAIFPRRENKLTSAVAIKARRLSDGVYHHV